jgi:hypothetical protein
MQNPPDEAMARAGRRQALRSGGCCSIQPESEVGELGDSEAAVAGRGDELRDPILDCSRASPWP